MKLSVLGPAELRASDGQEIRPILAQPKRFALLVYLALAGQGRLLRRDRVIALFWPELVHERGRAALRDALYHLRKYLGDAVVTRGGDEVGIDPARLEVDALGFRAAIAAGRLDEAITLYSADLLEGFNLPAAREFEDWLDRERLTLREQAAAAARQAGDGARGAGRSEDAARYYRRSLLHAPYQESVFRNLVDALEDAGDPAGAHSAYEQFEIALARDLDTTPSQATRERMARLRAPAANPPPREPAAPAPPPQRMGTPPSSGPAVPLEPVSTVPRAPVLRPPWLPLAAAFVLLVLGLYAAFSPGRNSALEIGPSTDLVVLPFMVRGTGSEYLSEGMVDLFATKLNGVGGIRSVDPQVLFALLRDRAELPVDIVGGLEIAKRFGAAHFVMGSVLQAGSTLQISAFLYDGSGRQLARAAGTGPDTALIAIVDDLARELLAGTFSEADRLAGVAAVNTSSLAALRHYLEGEQRFREGRFGDAAEALISATAIDSTFALAHYRLSTSADWWGRADIAEPAARAAQRFAGRLPSDVRRLVDARNESWFGDARRAEALYLELTLARPTDIEPAFELAEIRFHAGPWYGQSFLESEQAFRDVVRLDPTHVAAMVHLGRIAATTGRPPLLDSLLLAIQGVEPEHGGVMELRAHRAALLMRRDSIEAVIAELLDRPGVSPMHGIAERVAVYTGNLEFAEAIVLAQLPALDGSGRSLAYQSLAHFAVGRGAWDRAKEHLAALETLDPPIAAQVRANLVSHLPDPPPTDVAEAERALRAQIRFGSGEGPAADPHHFYDERQQYLLGLMAAIRGDSLGVARAVGVLERPGDDDDAAFARGLAALLRARSFAIAGDSAAALAELERGWLPPRKPLMVGWAWTYSHVGARALRATLLLQQNRYDEAVHWADSTLEDIAGSPLVLGRAEEVRAAALRALATK
jgi:DNA-binding SARP family transcriptional activator/TolB-like protein